MSLHIGNTRVRVSFWFFALAACIVLLDRDRLLVYFILPVLVHECGHIAVLLARRVPLREISFSPFGVLITRDPGAVLSYRAELLLCLGGIIANLLAAGVLWLACFHSMRLSLLVAANLAVALFSALPVSGLDGGQAVRLLAARFLSPGAARGLSAITSLIVLSALFAFAVYQLLSRNYNPTLLLSCGYLIYCVVRSV
jgi:stage IV sporulation protein FB